nr:hypothetical protein [Tanacetum cinerariifolium]
MGLRELMDDLWDEMDELCEKCGAHLISAAYFAYRERKYDAQLKCVPQSLIKALGITKWLKSFFRKVITTHASFLISLSELSSTVITKSSSNLAKSFSSRMVPSIECNISLPSKRRALKSSFRISLITLIPKHVSSFKLRVPRESFAYKEYGISLMLAPRWIPTGTTHGCLRWIPRSGLTWKATGRITGKVDNEPTHGSNVDIPHIHACKQSLDISADLVPQGEITSDQLESLFDPLLDEYVNGECKVVLKTSVANTDDASDKHQQQPDSTSSTSTLATTVTANGNVHLFKNSVGKERPFLLLGTSMNAKQSIDGPNSDKKTKGRELDGLLGVLLEQVKPSKENEKDNVIDLDDDIQSSSTTQLTEESQIHDSSKRRNTYGVAADLLFYCLFAIVSYYTYCL